MRRQLPRLSVLVGLAAGFSPVMAMAQVVEPFLPVPPLPTGPEVPGITVLPPRGTTVETRPRPEVDAQGVPLGSFFLFPRLEVDQSYNDNIFATAAPTTSDFITTIAPSFDFLSNWGRNALNFHAGAAIGEYASQTAQDYRDAFVSTDGRWDIDQGRAAYGGLIYQREHESRYSANFPGGAAEPSFFNTYGGNVGYAQTGLRIGYSADFSVNRYEYESVPAIGGGTIFQSNRNYTSPDAALRASYEFEEGLSAYVRGEGNYRDYDHGASETNPILDSAGYRADVGLHYDVTGVTVADLSVGYLDQMYSEAVYGSVHGIDVGAHVTWNPTTLDTVLFSVDRTVQDLGGNVLAPGLISPAYLDTVVAINGDHELLRNLLLNLNASYTNDDFKGIDRTDNDYGIGGGVKYLMNRYLYLGLSYTHSHRDSTGAQAANNFEDNIFMLRVSTQM